jgi:glycosyltransferase involved in cell wall biosynthesis
MGDAGWAVDPLQPEEMAAAISGLIKDERLRQDSIARGTARAAEFTWHRNAQLTLAVYARAAGAHRRRG